MFIWWLVNKISFIAKTSLWSYASWALLSSTQSLGTDDSAGHEATRGVCGNQERGSTVNLSVQKSVIAMLDRPLRDVHPWKAHWQTPDVFQNRVPISLSQQVWENLKDKGNLKQGPIQLPLISLWRELSSTDHMPSIAWKCISLKETSKILSSLLTRG